MSLQIIFDDTPVVPDAIRGLVGIESFGSIVFQRRSRHEAMRVVAAEAGAEFCVLRSAPDRDALERKLGEAGEGALHLVCPSNLVATGDDAAIVTFLKQLKFAPNAMQMPLVDGRERRGWLLMPTWLAAKYFQKSREGDLAGFLEQFGPMFVDVRDRVRLVDVCDERSLLDYLSGQFDARHFNAIEHDEFTVRKRSTDREKLKREFDFYRLTPPRMQMFLVQPFDFEDDGVTASYRMERVSVPDMALQWVHGAFQPAEFERFLAHIFHFIEVRPKMRAEQARAAAIRKALYLDKVLERVSTLKGLKAYPALEPLLARGVGGIDALVERYRRHYEKRPARGADLVIGHGDPCFSNILYSKTNQYLKLIDPRGASTEQDLYTDAYYDVAKLSHSIVGGYDFINQGKFDLSVDEALGFRLDLEGGPPPWARSMFESMLGRSGFEARLTRLFEASLFISMLPLHIDRPRKVLAFALNAALILDELDGTKGAT